LPIFTVGKRCNIITDAFIFCRKNKALAIYAWVMMDNHFHALVSAPDLSVLLANLKSFTAKRIIDQLEQDRCEWLLEQLSFYRLKHKNTSRHQVWSGGFASPSDGR
jgi:REP element-mobilizing transposase RayT